MQSSLSIVSNILSLGSVRYKVSRIHSFGIVIERPIDPIFSLDQKFSGCTDYLHHHLLMPNHRKSLIDLVAREGLVVCRNLAAEHESYRKVRGKSSQQRLSPAEYYHHDGVAGGEKPGLVEIRFPFQTHQRSVETAVAPFPDVLRAMWQALTQSMRIDRELQTFMEQMQDSVFWNFERAEYAAANSIRETQSFNRGGSRSEKSNDKMENVHIDNNFVFWEKMQGRMTRLVRREYDAVSCRAYFREVDQLAGAFHLPWQMGESRLMLNDHPDPALTMQHRRSQPAESLVSKDNGSLLKRWPVEELKLS